MSEPTNDHSQTIGWTDSEDGEPAIKLEPGTTLAGRYKLIRQIGRGGMGVVWSAAEIKKVRIVRKIHRIP